MPFVFFEHSGEVNRDIRFSTALTCVVGFGGCRTYSDFCRYARLANRLPTQQDDEHDGLMNGPIYFATEFFARLPG
jgi:hypothetical protein